MPKIARGNDTDMAAVDFFVGQDGNFRKSRNPLVLRIKNLKRPEPPAEINMMLGLKVLIRKDQYLVLDKGIVDFTK